MSCVVVWCTIVLSSRYLAIRMCSTLLPKAQRSFTLNYFCIMARLGMHDWMPKISLYGVFSSMYVAWSASKTLYGSKLVKNILNVRFWNILSRSSDFWLHLRVCTQILDRLKLQ